MIPLATEWTFEKAMTRLEQIVGALESGRCTLDESLKLFEEGTKLTAYCNRMLKTAEQKIVKLTSTADQAAGAAEEIPTEKTAETATPPSGEKTDETESV